MKILNSSPISSFGGLNFVLEELDKLCIDQILQKHLPKLSAQCKYSWKDILYTYWSIILCGGDCAEDASANLKHSFINSPFIKIPSPDRLLSRLKDLSVPVTEYKKNRSTVVNEFSINECLNNLNLMILNKLELINSCKTTLDYDNTVLYSSKADAKMTYKKATGYCPGVGIIGNNIVYIENRNGNCAPHAMQDDTLERMFKQFKKQNIKVDVFRADSASFQFSTICTVNKHVEKLYIRARMNACVNDAINKIENWKAGKR